MRQRPTPRRPDLYVIARFLDKLGQENAYYTRSSLQRGVGVNYDIFRRYLEWLLAKGWVEEKKTQDEKPLVFLTASGRAARERLLLWMLEMVGEPF